MTLRWIVVVALLSIARQASAQESQFHADLRREAEGIADSCDSFAPKALTGCVVQLATGDPFHVALGNLAPQNGFGFGLAFVEHYTPNESWRLSWNADGVRTLSGSWRAGAYMKIIHTPSEPGIIVVPPGGSSGANPIVIREYPVFNVYAQSTSLNTVLFYGTGQSSLQSGKSAFSEHQTIVGTDAIVPLTKPRFMQVLKPSLIGALNVRFVSVDGRASDSTPPIDELYDATTAPGLEQQPTFTQFEEGVRFKPSLPNGWVRFNYLVDFQQFVAGSSSQSSFHRWGVDLTHEIPLYRNVTSRGRLDTNGPDECFQAVGTNTCPPISTSRNREGTIAIRFFISSSSPSSGSAVPFYFQPTLGGSDINGQQLLGGYDDYRFRAPTAFAMQQTVEHSVWGPLGVYFLADQGMVADRVKGLVFSQLTHSYAVGATLRAGGFPLIKLSFAWSPEGNHGAATMDSTLLGGSSRPPL